MIWEPKKRRDNMMKATWKCGTALSIILACLFLPGGEASCSQARSGETPAGAGKIALANTEFGMRLYRELVGEAGDHNILISPTGLGMVLAMTYNGAGGHTAREMAGGLNLSGLDLDEVNTGYSRLADALKPSRNGIELNVANSLWADQDIPLKEDFLESNRTFYQADVTNLDLSDPGAPDVINTWIREETGSRMGPVIDGLDPDVVLYLINAMYFKGRWAIPFDTTYTAPRKFTLADGSTRMVPTMMTESTSIQYCRGGGFEAVGLPYGDGGATMYLFLPDVDSSLMEFYNGLDADTWSKWMTAFETGEALVLLPRFTVEHDVILNDALKALGMPSAFGDADFSRMTSARVFLSMVKHSTLLEVSEEGTEAASAAVVELKKGGQRRIHFNRPFFFAVADNATGAILFMGSVLDP
jgi:serpin B